MIIDKISQLIGNTPLIKISLTYSAWNLYIKLEKYNPGQSMKDRMAVNMIDAAERDGLLKLGGTIVESSSGNTATGLAMIAAERGYKFIAVVDHHACGEKIAIIKAYGSKVVIVDGEYNEDEVAVVARETLAQKIANETPNGFFVGQADNLNNSKAYEDTLAKELNNDLGHIDYLFASIGTGGSISGTARGLKKRNKNIKVVAIEPVGSTIFNPIGGPYFQSGTGNPVGAPIPGNVDYSVIDEHDYVTDKQAFNTCRYLASYKAIMVGGSSGGVIYKSIERALSLKGSGTIVAIAADAGEKYMSNAFNDEWLFSHNLWDNSVVDYLKENL